MTELYARDGLVDYGEECYCGSGYEKEFNSNDTILIQNSVVSDVDIYLCKPKSLAAKATTLAKCIYPHAGKCIVDEVAQLRSWAVKRIDELDEVFNPF